MVKIIAGDFPKGSQLSVTLGEASLFWGLKKDQKIDLKKNLSRIERVTEESKKKFLGSAGWGLLGGAALGPVGLIAGALAGGNKKEICFAGYLKDGRKFMAVSDLSTYQKLSKVMF